MTDIIEVSVKVHENNRVGFRTPVFNDDNYRTFEDFFLVYPTWESLIKEFSSRTKMNVMGLDEFNICIDEGFVPDNTLVLELVTEY